MNITRRDLFKSFYSKRIYFIHRRESFKEDVVKLSTLRGLMNVQCRDWEKTPVSYLSAKESLAVGIMLFVKKSYRGKKYIERAIQYCEYAYMETKDLELSYLGSLALGVLYFELALVETDKVKQDKLFKTSTAYLKTAAELAPSDDHSCLYHAVVQRGRGVDLELVAKTLVRASKATDSPKAIYQLLINIYTKLSMEKAASFYQNKMSQIEEDDLIESRLVA